MDELIKNSPIVISIFALFVATLNFYFSHHHNPKKLYFLPSINIRNFNKREVIFYLVNGSRNDIVILSISLQIKKPNNEGWIGNDENYISSKSNNYSIKSGEAAQYTAHFPLKFDFITIDECGTKNETKTNIQYYLHIKWFHPNGELNESGLDFFTIGINSSNKFCSLNIDSPKSKNLYIKQGI